MQNYIEEIFISNKLGVGTVSFYPAQTILLFLFESKSLKCHMTAYNQLISAHVLSRITSAAIEVWPVTVTLGVPYPWYGYVKRR